jgi:predicted RNA-binding Zn ribbon-like protein
MSEFKRSLETLEIIGGALCMDFVNTINSRQHPEHEYLTSYPELANWGAKIGVLSTEQNHRLQKQAKQDEKTAEHALKKAIDNRELLFRLFVKLAKGSEPNKQDMTDFTKVYGEAISSAQLVREEDRFSPRWKLDQNLEALLWPIIYSAGEILFSKEVNQVKECPSCGWLFLDTSKNQTRRWCSMNTCGARDKMRRYHGKLRAKS